MSKVHRSSMNMDAQSLKRPTEAPSSPRPSRRPSQLPHNSRINIAHSKQRPLQPSGPTCPTFVPYQGMSSSRILTQTNTSSLVGQQPRQLLEASTSHTADQRVQQHLISEQQIQQSYKTDSCSQPERPDLSPFRPSHANHGTGQRMSDPSNHIQPSFATRIRPSSVSAATIQPSKTSQSEECTFIDYYNEPDPSRGRRQKDGVEDKNRKQELRERHGGACCRCKKDKRKCTVMVPTTFHPATCASKIPCDVCSRVCSRVKPKESEVCLLEGGILNIDQWFKEYPLKIENGTYIQIKIKKGPWQDPWPGSSKFLLGSNLNNRGSILLEKLLDMSIDISPFATAFLSEAVELDARSILRVISAFLESYISAPVELMRLARNVCGILFACLLKRLHQTTEDLSKDIVDFFTPAQFCRRPNESAIRCNVFDLYHHILLDFNRLPTSGKLNDLIGPLQTRAANVVQLVQTKLEKAAVNFDKVPAQSGDGILFSGNTDQDSNAHGNHDAAHYTEHETYKSEHPLEIRYANISFSNYPYDSGEALPTKANSQEHSGEQVKFQVRDVLSRESATGPEMIEQLITNPQSDSKPPSPPPSRPLSTTYFHQAGRPSTNTEQDYLPNGEAVDSDNQEISQGTTQYDRQDLDSTIAVSDTAGNATSSKDMLELNGIDNMPNRMDLMHVGPTMIEKISAAMKNEQSNEYPAYVNPQDLILLH